MDFHAFPQPMMESQNGGGPITPASYGYGGMTIREYFAGRALQGIISHYGVMLEKPPTCAKNAVELADALIAELEKPTLQSPVSCVPKV